MESAPTVLTVLHNDNDAEATDDVMRGRGNEEAGPKATLPCLLCSRSRVSYIHGLQQARYRGHWQCPPSCAQTAAQQRIAAVVVTKGRRKKRTRGSLRLPVDALLRDPEPFSGVQHLCNAAPSTRRCDGGKATHPERRRYAQTTTSRLGRRTAGRRITDMPKHREVARALPQTADARLSACRSHEGSTATICTARKVLNPERSCLDMRERRRPCFGKQSNT